MALSDCEIRRLPSMCDQGELGFGFASEDSMEVKEGRKERSWAESVLVAAPEEVGQGLRPHDHRERSFSIAGAASTEGRRQ